MIIFAKQMLQLLCFTLHNIQLCFRIQTYYNKIDSYYVRTEKAIYLINLTTLYIQNNQGELKDIIEFYKSQGYICVYKDDFIREFYAPFLITCFDMKIIINYDYNRRVYQILYSNNIYLLIGVLLINFMMRLVNIKIDLRSYVNKDDYNITIQDFDYIKVTNEECDIIQIQMRLHELFQLIGDKDNDMTIRSLIKMLNHQPKLTYLSNDDLHKDAILFIQLLINLQLLNSNVLDKLQNTYKSYSYLIQQFIQIINKDRKNQIDGLIIIEGVIKIILIMIGLIITVKQ